MGTRSLTVFQEKDGTEIVVMYQQYDGYPTGHGQDLKDFLEPFVVVNGIKSRETRKIANGMGCLAAQIVAHFKDSPGGFYLYPAGTRGADEEYIYTVWGPASDGPVHLRVEDAYGNGVLYEGPISDFDPVAAENREEE